MSRFVLLSHLFCFSSYEIRIQSFRRIRILSLDRHYEQMYILCKNVAQTEWERESGENIKKQLMEKTPG